jgi:hypothetical protein
MMIFLSFLVEDYGILPHFPEYRDSLRFSINYYVRSRYPMLGGCLKGFCAYVGTYNGYFRDSTFLLRDHAKVIDTIRVNKIKLQEMAILERYFGTGSLTLGFEVGLIREIYASFLYSKRDVFYPNNSLSLGKFKQGTIFGALIGYDFKGWFSYILLRYRNLSKDSSLSSGDTTGWYITVPAEENGRTEILIKSSSGKFSLKIYKRDNFGAYFDRENHIRKFLVKVGGGFYGREPVFYGNFGYKLGNFNIILGLGYYGGFYFGLAGGLRGS